MRRRFPFISLGLGLAIAIGGAAGYLLDQYRYHGGSVIPIHHAWELGVFEKRLTFRLTRNADTVANFRRVAVWRNKDPHPIGYYAATRVTGQARRSFDFQHGTWASEPHATTGTWWSVGVPYWSISILGALLAARGGWIVWRRRRAVATGLCPVCRYDLRASPERCPECGTTVQPHPNAGVR